MRVVHQLEVWVTHRTPASEAAAAATATAAAATAATATAATPPPPPSRRRNKSDMLLYEALLAWLRPPQLNTAITGPRFGRGFFWRGPQIVAVLRRWPCETRPNLGSDPAYHTPNTKVGWSRPCVVVSSVCRVVERRGRATLHSSPSS